MYLFLVHAQECCACTRNTYKYKYIIFMKYYYVTSYKANRWAWLALGGRGGWYSEVLQNWICQTTVIMGRGLSRTQHVSNRTLACALQQMTHHRITGRIDFGCNPFSCMVGARTIQELLKNSIVYRLWFELNSSSNLPATPIIDGVFRWSVSNHVRLL